MKQQELVLPAEITKELLSILLADQKAQLLLKGFIAGREIVGQFGVTAGFKIVTTSELVDDTSRTEQ